MKPFCIKILVLKLVSLIFVKNQGWVVVLGLRTNINKDRPIVLKGRGQSFLNNFRGVMKNFTKYVAKMVENRPKHTHFLRLKEGFNVIFNKSKGGKTIVNFF